ncbi:MAG: sulfatase family protein [Luteolibacter sp.]
MIRLLLILFLAVSLANARQPNFVVIFVDDLGYGDLGCYGSKTIKTPRIDGMAKEGMRFTHFYAQTVCGPSRAALMTGSYPLRVATLNNRVETHPRLHSEEITMAEVLKEAGYATGAFGKWDLAGHTQTNYTKELLPTYQGFDYFFGTPSSNDSIIHLLRNDEMIEKNASMATITRRLTDEAIGFIQRNHEKPFLVYLAHPMPHVRLEASEQFLGKSKAGIYGDVVEEIDWNVGRILDELKKLKLDEHTYVLFLSDNGPWYLGRSKHHLKSIGPDAVKHGGTASPLRGDKTTIWEGGVRVPCIIRAPGKVPAGVTSKAMSSTMDLMPTLAKLGGGKVPTDRIIDGHDLSRVWLGVQGAISPRTTFYYYQQTRLQAVRSGKWKLHLPGHRLWPQFAKEEDMGPISKPMLYDLEAEIDEQTNLAEANPEVVKNLMVLAEEARNDVGDHNRMGAGARFFDKGPKRPDIKRSKQ